MRGMFLTRPVASVVGAALFAAALAMPALAASETTWQRLLDGAKEPQNWLTHHRSLDAQRYSPLRQINRNNVEGLNVAWTFELGGIEGGGIWPHGGLEGTPVVEDGFMYVTDGWGTVYKIDLRGSTGKLMWKMDPGTDKDWVGAVICCGVDNRGVALWKSRVVSHTLDGRLILTDKETGRVVWERKKADPAIGETVTAAPLVIKDMAITGVSGGELGIRGWLAATDLNTGDELWRTYTIPGPGEPGHATWKDSHDAWKTGGGPTWLTGSYDPELDMIYWGVGNPAPSWDPEYRPGDNLYTESVVAVDAMTGAIKWHFQYTPNDPYDYDGVGEQVLVDAIVKDRMRKAVLHADRNGFAYALDRVTGEFLWGTAFVNELTWTDGLDANGRPASYDPNSDVQLYKRGTAPNRRSRKGVSCPGNMGGKNWPPTAYHPGLNRYYIPVIESCNTLTNKKTTPRSYKPRKFFTGGGLKQHQQITGSVTAIDVNTGAITGKYETEYPMLGGVLATAGDLVFVGHPSGGLVALDAETLTELWRFETGKGLNAPPMTFAVGGKQFVAILAGLGGAWPKWFVGSTKGLEKMKPSSLLYVFSL